MYISGLIIVEDYFYEDYLKTRHTIKLSYDKQIIYVTNKEKPILLINSKAYTPLVEAIYNDLSLDVLLNEPVLNIPIFFSTFLLEKYRHMLREYSI